MFGFLDDPEMGFAPRPQHTPSHGGVELHVSCPCPNTQIQDVAEFHEATGQEEGKHATILRLRARLCDEEANELDGAIANVCREFSEHVQYCDLVEVAKEAVDLAYVAIGTLVQLFGVEKAQLVWDAVHQSNMAKAPAGVVRRDAGGKILKPDGWQKPDIAAILESYEGN